MAQLSMKIIFWGLLLITGSQSPLRVSGCSSSSARRTPVSFTAQMVRSVGEAPSRCEQLSSGCVGEAQGLGSGEAEKDLLPNPSLLTSSKGQSCSHNQQPHCKWHVTCGILESGGERCLSLLHTRLTHQYVWEIRWWGEGSELFGKPCGNLPSTFTLNLFKLVQVSVLLTSVESSAFCFLVS